MIQTYSPHAMLVVMAVDDISSLELAEHILVYLSHSGSLEEKAVILVANKADLVRNREIKTAAGKELAIKYNIKYIETSPGRSNNLCHHRHTCRHCCRCHSKQPTYLPSVSTAVTTSAKLPSEQLPKSPQWTTNTISLN